MEKSLTNPKINFEVASPTDTTRLAQFYREFYPTLGWSDRYLQWQYYDNPAGRATSWIASLGNEIIGAYSVVPFALYIKGKICLGWRSQDVLTRPEYSGLGIYYRLSQYINDSIHFTPLNFAFPNERSHNGFIKNSWLDAFEIPLRILDNISAHSYQMLSCQISPLTHFDAHIEEIWSAYTKYINFALHRTARYLNWRYFASPKGKYFPFRLSFADEELILILKYHDRENGERWAHICDIFQSGNNLELRMSALKHAINFSLSLGCKALSCWYTRGHEMEKLFDELGFILQRELARWFVVRTDEQVITPTEVSCENRWHLAMGDSDIF